MFRKIAIRLALTALLLLIQAACIPFGDAWVHFSGHVKDPEGKPIGGAQLKILFDGKPGDRSTPQTNDAGEYKFFENSCPCEFKFEVMASKEGYKTYTKKMTGHEANSLNNLEIVLERADTTAAPSDNGMRPTPR